MTLDTPAPPLGAPSDVQPIGLAAAAAELAGESAPPPPIELDAVPTAPPASVAIWTRVARSSVRMGTDYLATVNPVWKASETEVEELSAAWGEALALTFRAPTPMAQAFLVTGLWAAPRTLKILADKRREQREARQRGSGGAGDPREREELLDEALDRDAAAG